MKFEILKAKSGKEPFYWRIVAGNNQVLATSETYTSEQGCRNAIEVVKRDAAKAPVIEPAKARAR